MNVKNLQDAGFLVPYAELSPDTVEEVKCRLLDTVMSLLGGAFAMSAEELEQLRRLIPQGDVKPVWGGVPGTSLEMAGFVNGYMLRYTDWGDTYRRACGIGVGGHPSDTLASLLALCDVAHVPGEKMIELINLGYRMWAAMQEKMLYKRLDIDYTTTIGLIAPIYAGLCFGATPERIQNAVNLSASGAMILEQVRPADITNMKSGATGYSSGRGLWCYKYSELLQAPKSMFDGEKGWYAYVAPYDGEFVMPEELDPYDTVQMKLFPAFNCAQGPLDCILDLYDRIKDRLDEISRVELRFCEGDWAWVHRPGQAKYPPNQSEADHHLPYCVACTLLAGTMTPLQYTSEYFNSQRVRDFIDLVDMQQMTDEEYQSLGGIEGAIALEIKFKDGSSISTSRTSPAGQFTGKSRVDRVKGLRAAVERKRGLLEKATGADLSGLFAIVDSLEDTDGKTLVAELRALAAAE